MGLAEGLPSKLSWRAEHPYMLQLHTSAPWISQSCLYQSKLLARILGRVPEASKHLAPAFLDLATAADKHDWRSIEDVDVPLRQRHLSHSIDEASYIHLITRAPDTCSKALALSTAIPHTGDWLNVIPLMPLASISMTGSSAYASSIGWASRWSRRGPDALFAKWWPIPWVTIRWVVAVMGTESTGMTPSGTRYSLQLKLMLLRPGRRCPL